MTVDDFTTVAHQLPGRLRLRLRQGAQRDCLVAIEDSLMRASGVYRARVNEAAASIVVEYDAARQSAEALLALPVRKILEREAERAQIEESIELPASPEEVWSILDAPGATASQFPAVFRVQEAAPNEWLVTLDLLGEELNGRVRLTESTPPQRIAVVLNGDVSGRCVLSLSALPGGTGTRLREQVFYELPGALLARTIGKLAGPAIRRLVREHLASVERAIQDAAARGGGAESHVEH